jgi:cell division protein FtsN
MPTRTLAAVATALALVATAACASTPTRWLADDLGRDGNQYYTTCEDSTNERHEKEVWLTEDQAEDHFEGQPCPDGPLRTGEYWEAPDRPRTIIVVQPPPRNPNRPLAPANQGGKPATPAPSASSSAKPAPTSAATTPKTTPKITPTTTPKPTR